MQRRYCIAILLLCALVTPDSATARTLEEALVSTFPGQLRKDGEGLAQVFAHTVAASFPVTGTSSSHVYHFDPATDSFLRLDTPLGPVFSERADTVGRHKLNLGANYLLVKYDTINGQDLDPLVSHDPTQPGDHITICAGPLCEPVLGIARLDLEAQIIELSATYGLTADLDINLSLPLVRTFLRSSTSFTGPDPRAPNNENYFPYQEDLQASEASSGVGDLLLRVKYLLARNAPVNLAAGLTLSLPTGTESDFHGTGDTLVGAALYGSQLYLERVEPHVNLSFVLDANKFDRSQVRYSVGADVRVVDWLTLNNDFLGTSDVAQPDTISQPVFVQIERADVFQFSTGIKIAPPWHNAVSAVPVLRDLPERGFGLPWVWFFNVLLPINRDGVRSDHVFIFGAEAVF